MVFSQRRGFDGIVGVMFGCSVFDHTRSELLAAEDVQAEVYRLCCRCVLMGQMRLAGFEEGVGEGRREKGEGRRGRKRGPRFEYVQYCRLSSRLLLQTLVLCMSVQKQPRRPRSATTPFLQHRDPAA
jgi:hypothetical protein